MIAASLIATLALAQAAAPPIDEGTLVVRIDTQEVARETFHLVAHRVSNTTSGWVLVATARWSEGGRTVVFAPVIEMAPDSEPGALAFNVVANGTSLHITGQPGPGRYTLRYLAAGIERARELPAAIPIVVVDDSVFSPFLFAAWRAAATPTTLTAVFPRQALRASLTVEYLGTGVTTLNRDPATLRHILVTGGPSGPVHVWLSAEGRLMKVEVPNRALSAERLPE